MRKMRILVKSRSRTSNPRIMQWRFEWINGKRQDHYSGRGVVTTRIYPFSVDTINVDLEVNANTRLLASTSKSRR
jgi:hypothetical protein